LCALELHRKSNAGAPILCALRHILGHVPRCEFPKIQHPAPVPLPLSRLMPHQKLRKLRPLFSRPYQAKRGSCYRRQLDVWADRIGIGHIQFQTPRCRDNDRMYEAIPICKYNHAIATHLSRQHALVPQMDQPNLLPDYARYGASKARAQQASMLALRGAPPNMGLIRWEFIPDGPGFRALPHGKHAPLCSLSLG
jgi:hypothetical protein